MEVELDEQTKEREREPEIVIWKQREALWMAVTAWLSPKQVRAPYFSIFLEPRIEKDFFSFITLRMGRVCT